MFWKTGCVVLNCCFRGEACISACISVFESLELVLWSILVLGRGKPTKLLPLPVLYLWYFITLGARKVTLTSSICTKVAESLVDSFWQINIFCQCPVLWYYSITEQEKAKCKTKWSASTIFLEQGRCGCQCFLFSLLPTAPLLCWQEALVLWCSSSSRPAHGSPRG